MNNIYIEDNLVISTVIAVSTLLSCDCSPAMKRLRTLTIKFRTTEKNYNEELLWVYISNLGHFYFVDLRWSTASTCQGNIELEKMRSKMKPR